MKPTRHFHVAVSKKSPRARKFDIHIEGSGFKPEDLRILFNLLRDFASESDTFATFPVIRELEDPELMKKLDKIMADVRSGKAKLTPWEDVKAELRAKAKIRKSKYGKK